MLTSSAKAKGRALAKWLKDAILARNDVLGSGDITVTSSGTTGEDLGCSPAARARFPYQVECKNHARMAVYDFYDQAVGHGSFEPLVVIKANRRKPLVVVDAEHFLDLVRKTTTT